MLRRRPPLVPDVSRRPTREPVVPMINVVFLLLVFFMITAQIAPEAPFEMRLPSAEGTAGAAVPALFVSERGEAAFAGLRGEKALAAAAAEEGPLVIEAHAALDAADLARLLARLGRLGARDVHLSTVAP